MPQLQPATQGEARVVRWFVVVFLALASLGIGLSWLSKEHECAAQCVANGQGTGSLEFTGGSRLSMGTACVCTAEPEAK